MMGAKTFVNLFVCSILFLNFCFTNCDRFGEHCRNDTLYDSNSFSGRIYRANLDFLFSVLASNASNPNGFYNFTTSGGGAAADPENNTTVYGLFLCRGDVGPTDCQGCVKTAGSEALQLCPDRKAATVWYDKCMLRYADRSISSTLEGRGFNVGNKNMKNATNPELFGQVLLDTFNQVITAAAFDPSGKKFAVRESNRSGVQKIYALGQCTPDLSSSDCRTCLGGLVQLLPDYYPQGSIVLALSCNIRYGMYLFYNVSNYPPPPLPPPLLLHLAPATSKGHWRMSTNTIIAIVVPTIVSIAALIVLYRARTGKKKRTHRAIGVPGGIPKDVESLRYKFSEVKACTSNFSDQNIIGKGGFGPVYKGTLPNGQVVAVKRLSKSSAQGGVEFINEIALVTKLQHRNLVRLLGYCLEREEKILIYEFIVNKSLDHFIFDLNKKILLDWSTRLEIIGGTAKGLLYLHEDSHFKIIHRDLKASNVLLDDNMKPKISDFGMAKLFEFDQSQGNTSRIAGTFGYMAPEYIFHGMLSVKSDVFSFGVLVLEIVTGKKNSNFQGSGDDDLLSYVWKQWKDGTALAVMDPSIKDSYNKNEVIRCIHIGLLCVVEEVQQRPTMTSILFMLNNHFLSLPEPNPPAYFGRSRRGNLSTGIHVLESNQPSSDSENHVSGESIVEVYPI